MFIRVCNSGSKGNGYAIGNEKEVLILEAGCKFADMKKTLNFNVSNIIGICVSHSHKDHNGHIEEYEKAGIKSYKPWIDEGIRIVEWGGFKIQAFKLIHDVPCSGFYIRHRDLGKLLFITDTEYVPVLFKNQRVNHIICEANYQEDKVSDDEIKMNRVYQTHMELQTTKGFINANKTEDLRTVILCHLSDSGSDEEEVLSEIKGIVNESVTAGVARKGRNWDLSLIPF